MCEKVVWIRPFGEAFTVLQIEDSKGFPAASL